MSDRGILALKLKLTRSPYRHMLDDPQFRLWMENLERGSAITAHEYYRRMGRICRELGVTPESLASMDEKKAGNFLLAMVSHWEGRNSLAKLALVGLASVTLGGLSGLAFVY